MIEVVEVTEVNGDEATVFIQRSTACKDCGMCMVGKKNLEVYAHVKNTLNAQVGDKVTVEMELRNVLSASLIIYSIPLAGFIIGLILGFNVFAEMWGTPADLTGFGLGLLFLAAVYFVIKLIDKKGVFKETYELTMKGIVEHQEQE